MSATVWRPVMSSLSSLGPRVMFSLEHPTAIQAGSPGPGPDNSMAISAEEGGQPAGAGALTLC